MIKITQNNLHHDQAAAEALSYKLDQNASIKPNLKGTPHKHIACIQEPYFPRDKPLNVPLSHETYYSNKKTAPRAIIQVSKPYNQEIMFHENYSDRDTCTISIKDPNNNTKRLYITSVYMPHKEHVKDSMLTKILKEIETKKLGIIICSDTNSHSTLWGNENTNTRGEKLELLIAEFNLEIINTTFEATWSNAINSSTIDLTITNSHAPKIKNWKVLKDESLSDHEIIQFHIDKQPESPTTQTKYQKKCDYEIFNKKVKEKINISRESSQEWKNNNYQNNHITSKKEIDHETNKLTSIIIQAHDEACATTNTTKGEKKKKWTYDMKTQHSRLIRTKKRISYLKIIKWKKPLIQKQKDYRAGKATFKKLLQQTQNKNWTKYASEITKLKDTARLAKVTNSKNTKIGALSKDDGSFTTSPNETLHHLADKLLGKESTQNTNKTEINTQNENEKTTNIQQYINRKRLHKAVKLLKKDKAPGSDGITNEMIVNSLDHIETTLLNIFTACIEKEYVPSSWQTANSAIIAKPGKDDYSKAKSYRIISLTSNLLKILETLILWHLQTDLKMEKAINKNQYGFRRGHATDTAILNLVNKIQRALKRGNHALGIFLDIEGAFDNLPFEAIKKALDKTEAKGQVSNWIINMIKNRYITLKLGSTSITRHIPKGCPQGGVLSPFLWNLVLNEILDIFNKQDIIQAFADDLNLTITGTDTGTIFEQATHYTNCINTWCEQTGLKISELKTQIIFWTREHNIKHPQTIKIKNKHIELTSSVKYLGIILDNKLNWTEHIKYTVKKCIRAIYAAKKAIGKTWGLSPKKLRWIYTAIILPKLTYGAVVWAFDLTSRNIKTLSKVQHLISVLITKAQHSTAQLALDTLLGLLPLDIKLKQTSMLRAITIKAENHWKKLPQGQPR